MKIAVLLYTLLLAVRLPAQSLPDTATWDLAALDSTGFLYVTGTIAKPVLPTTPGVFQPAISATCQSGCAYGYLAKLSPTGQIVWASYLGLTQPYAPTALLIAPNQNVYVARSSADSATLPPFKGYQSAYGPIFVVEISSDGKTVLSGTYFGGPGDQLSRIRSDSAGNIYIAGTAKSGTLPVTPGTYQPPQQSFGITCDGPGDPFLAKFDSTLNRLIFSAVPATPAPELLRDLAVGLDGSSYLLTQRCSAHSFEFATTLTHLTPDASKAIYSLTVADANFEGSSVVVDSNGFAYASGDNAQFSGPGQGSIKKIDPLGNIVAEQPFSGRLSLSGNQLIAISGLPTGGFSHYTLPISADSPPTCTEFDSTGFTGVTVLVRMNTATLHIDYAGYLPSRNAQMIGPDKLLVQRPYASTTQFAIQAPGSPPPGTITCVGSAAGYDGYEIAPGEVLTLFGNQIGPATPFQAEYDAAGNLTSSLGGVEVLADGQPVPLLYASSGQINLIAPFALVPDAVCRLQVRRNGVVIASYDALVSAIHLRLFTIDGSAAGPLAALNQDGSVNTAANPAAPGSIVSLFGTGLGAMTPTPIDGSRPLSISNHPVASVQSNTGAILYSGNAPGLVEGVVQINLRLPSALNSGLAAIFLYTLDSRLHGVTPSTVAIGSLYVK